MTTTLDRYRSSSRRRARKAAEANIRLDLQGLRAAAVLAVVAHSVWGQPVGGFVGIDIFLVLSGYLVTASLLRAGKHSKTMAVGHFYWGRLLRVVPAATVVLLLTYVASLLVLPRGRAEQVGVDALSAFAFAANWHFAFLGADPFAGPASASPLQHFWALSVGEQFWLVWPLLILVAAMIAATLAWSQARKTALVAGIAAVVITASLAWSLYSSASTPDWAYFNTFSRLWELGVGALPATAAGFLARTPMLVKPLLSWAGVAIIVASVFVITETTVGYPAPWALLPVAGAALVIAAGIGGEPAFQPLLRNRVSTYLGDLAFALFLVHWPVIVLLHAEMKTSVYFYASALSLMFGLALLLHHGIEKPLRHASREKIRDGMRAMEHGLLHIERATKVALVAGLVLVTLALVSYAMRPEALEPAAGITIVQPR
ncbi:acyltransferase family protein [Mycolicibacterium sp. D3]|uniref:Acyltransferase n=1 Tax=Mycolicibacterium parafortuitum TaxID=39692 RepID=A0ACC6MEU3_MYCPF|nr:MULTISPECIES: acyltransferase [Mycobacteriaceae]MDZ5085422.1 acyltransferase [Mycolicibacterium parafortuitum]